MERAAAAVVADKVFLEDDRRAARLQAWTRREETFISISRPFFQLMGVSIVWVEIMRTIFGGCRSSVVGVKRRRRILYVILFR